MSTEKMGRAENKTIVVTGAAQGFGEGISVIYCWKEPILLLPI